MKGMTVETTIREVSPMRNTVNGNNRKKVETEDGLWTTAEDSHVGLVIGNREYAAPNRVRLSLDRRWRITAVEVL